MKTPSVKLLLLAKVLQRWHQSILPGHVPLLGQNTHWVFIPELSPITVGYITHITGRCKRMLNGKRQWYTVLHGDRRHTGLQVRRGWDKQQTGKPVQGELAESGAMWAHLFSMSVCTLHTRSRARVSICWMLWCSAISVRIRHITSNNTFIHCFILTITTV